MKKIFICTRRGEPMCSPDSAYTRRGGVCPPEYTHATAKGRQTLPLPWTFILLLSSVIFQLSSCTSEDVVPSPSTDALAEMPKETPIAVSANIAAMQTPATRAASDTWYANNEIHPDKEEVNFALSMPGGSENTRLDNYDGNAFKDLPTLEPFASLMLKDFNLTEGDDRCVSRWTYLSADHSGLDYLYGFARLTAGADGKPVLDYGKLTRAYSKVTIRLVDSQGQAVPVRNDDGYTLSATIHSAHTAVAPIYLTDEAGNGTDFDSHCEGITTLAADKAIDPDNIALAAYEYSTELWESFPDAMVSADGNEQYWGEQNNELSAIVPPTATHTPDEDYIYFTPIANPSFTDEEKLTISVTSDPDGDGPLTTGTYTLKLKDIVMQGENGEVKTESEPSTFPLSAFRSGTHYVITVTLDHNRLVTGTAQLAAWNQTEAEVTLGGDPSYIHTVDGSTTDTEVWKAAIKEAYEKNIPLILTGTTLAMDKDSYSYFRLASSELVNAGEVPAGSIDLVLPDFTELPEFAFSMCESLGSVSAPSATTIGDNAFYECKNLAGIDLPKATSIGEFTFCRCEALTTVNLPAVTTIEMWAFADCTALTTVNLPAVTTIGEYAFVGHSTALTTVTFGSVITSMGDDAFVGANTTNCTLTLAAGQKESATLAPNGNTWAGYTWGEIKFTE